MNFSKTQVFMIGGGVFIVLLIVLLFTGVIPGLRTGSGTIKGSLTVWGVFDPDSVIRTSLIDDFQKKNPAIRVTYVQKDPLTYEQDLINAQAAGTGPDVFYFKNTWLLKHGDKVLPADPKLLPVQQIAAVYPDVVVKDFTDENYVYALPLYIDTMALFYNKSIFDNAGIALPPQTWEAVTDAIKRISRFNQTGQIIRAGAAIGASSRSINEATDLLNLIMLQDGSSMVTPDGKRANFSFDAGKAVSFYTSFSNPRSSQYTWDPSQGYSIDAFAEENVGMIFNYDFQIAQLKAKNPFLNFSVAPMPQFAGQKKNINYASYFGLAVSSQSKSPALAWNFVMNSTMDPVANGSYLVAASRPPALRTLIESNINNPDIGIFLRQALTATSWPQIDSSAIDQIFTQMIDSINAGQRSLDVALRQAEESITTLMRRSSN